MVSSSLRIISPDSVSSILIDGVVLIVETRGHALIRGLILLCLFHASALHANQHGSKSIITLSPHLAELVFLLGAGDQLKGVVEHSDFPEQVKSIPRVGGATGLDLERVLSIDPDLVLAWQGGTRETDIRRLKELGLRVVSIKSETLEDIPDSLKILGVLLNKQQQASNLIEKFNKHLKRIAEKNRGQASHKVFIEISSQPLMGLTNRHPFGTGLGLCGLINIFSDVDKAAIIADIESIFGRGVEYVLLRQNTTSNDYIARKKFYQINDYSAVKFVSFGEDSAFRQTPRLLDAVDEVCSTVYGLN